MEGEAFQQRASGRQVVAHRGLMSRSPRTTCVSAESAGNSGIMVERRTVVDGSF